MQSYSRVLITALCFQEILRKNYQIGRGVLVEGEIKDYVSTWITVLITEKKICGEGLRACFEQADFHTPIKHSRKDA